MAFDVTIYGSRGSIPVSGPDFLEFGGNTVCVLVEIDNARFIFDAGSGLVPLGNDLNKLGPGHAELFISHPHYDHLLGLPFFSPLFHGDTTLNVWSAGCPLMASTDAVLDQYVSPPYFPVCLEMYSADILRKTFKNSDVLSFSNRVIVKTIELNHPGGSTGYRIERDGRSFCYITDVEHDNGPLDEALSDFMKDAELVIIDATYSEQDYRVCKGYGHATWTAASNICEAGNVKQWLLFHHGFQNTDAILRAGEKDIQKRFPKASFAREGQVFHLDPEKG